MTLRLCIAAVLVLASQSAGAQPPTEPSVLDFSCYGYDEGATRAYNCIPAPDQQPLMRTFVPPVGVPCAQGQVAEFPAGRIVFQIRCSEDPNAPRPGTAGPGKKLWSSAGQGNMRLIKPLDALRIRLRAEYHGVSDHVAVFCLNPVHTLVIALPVGSYWGLTAVEQIVYMPECSEITVETDPAVAWWLTEEISPTAATLQRAWSEIPGGADWPAKALQDLAAVTDLQRAWGQTETVQAVKPRPEP